MEFFTALAGLKTASELTTRLREALKSRDVKLDEVVARIIEIQDMISDGRTALIDAQELLLNKNELLINKNNEIRSLKESVSALEASLAKEHSFVFRHGAYWQMVEGKGHEDLAGNVLVDINYDGPFCPLCKDTNNKAVRLRDLGNYERDTSTARWCCDIHGTDYSIPRGFLDSNHL